MEIPSKLDISEYTGARNNDANGTDGQVQREQELNEIRTSRITPVTKRWKPVDKAVLRSKSALPIGRKKLADSSWVLERPSSQVFEEEKVRRQMELETVKQARLEQSDMLESEDRTVEEKTRRFLELESVKQARLQQADILEVDRPSSRIEGKARYETLKELEAVKTIRREGVNEDDFCVEGMGTGPCHQNERKVQTQSTAQEVPAPSPNHNGRVLRSDDNMSSVEENKVTFSQVDKITEQRERAR